MLKIYIIDKSKQIRHSRISKKGKPFFAGKMTKKDIPIWLKIGAAILLVIIAFVTVLAPTANAMKGEGAMGEIEGILKRGAEENSVKYGLAPQRLHFSDFGFESEMEAKIHLNNVLQDLSIKNENLGENWSYNDKVMFANFIKLSNDDISQTILGLKSGRVENTEIIKPFTQNPEIFRASGFIGQAYLTQRWDEMDNPQQKTAEIMLANLIEAYAIASSKQVVSQQIPWQLEFGINFNV